MSITKDSGNLSTYRGDSFNITFHVKGLRPTTLYNIFFQINFDVPLIKQKEITTDQDGNSKVIYNVSKTETDVISKKYTYGLKACRLDEEDTIYTGSIEVKIKYVEGN